jgi:hypothetical protein
MLGPAMAETVKDEPSKRREAGVPSSPGLLVAYSGEAPCFYVLPLRKGRLALGRDDLAALHLADERVSHRHIEVEHDGEIWTVRDHGSTNGTFLDGAPLDGERTLRAPRVVRIGRTLLLPVGDATHHALHGLTAEGDRIIGPSLRRAHEQIARIARAGQGLLLTGGSGSGKEVAARVYHEAGGGKRAGARPFVALNCATVQRELAERILFGARRVAFERAVAIADEHRLVQEEVTPAYAELFELHAGREASPPAEVARLRSKARTLGRRFPAHEGAWLRGEALLLARRGDVSKARRTLSRALDAFRERGMRHELARTWEVMASFEQGEGQARARARALALYRETGARADASRVEASLAGP